MVPPLLHGTGQLVLLDLRQQRLQAVPPLGRTFAEQAERRADVAQRFAHLNNILTSTKFIHHSNKYKI